MAPLDQYVSEINAFPPVSDHEALELVGRMRAGDVAAPDRLLRGSLRFVVPIALPLAGKSLSLQDLIEEGNWALVRALDEFDRSVHTSWKSYVVSTVRQALQRITK